MSTKNLSITIFLACTFLVLVPVKHAEGVDTWIPILPLQRAGHEITVDTANSRLIMFGGVNWENYLNDTWSVQLRSGVPFWKKIPGGSTLPPGRKLFSMIYHPERQSIVMFGGYADAYFNDTWELQLEKGQEQWEFLTTGGFPPYARDGHVAVYDPQGNRMIVFAGRMSPTMYLNDTWILDFDSMTWEFLSIAGPPARANFEAVYDSNAHRMIIFGGEAPGYVYYNDVWALDLTEGEEEWTELDCSGDIPHGRSSLCLEFDPEGSSLILFGGQWYSGGAFFYANDILTLDLLSCVWEEISFPGKEPYARRTAASGLMKLGGKNFLFIHGGSRAYSDFFGDAWVAAFD